MLLPHDFSLVDNFCRVPVQKEIWGIEAVLGRVKPALSKSREVPMERALGTSASSETAVMSQQGDDRRSKSCSVRGKVWLAGFLLLGSSSFFSFLREGTEQREPCWSFVTSVTSWILRSLLTARANEWTWLRLYFPLVVINLSAL